MANIIDSKTNSKKVINNPPIKKGDQMNPKMLIFGVLLLLGPGLAGLQAQDAILASGGNGSNIGGSVSYSIGLIVYSTYTGANGSAAQGVQQPFEISVGLDEVEGISLYCSAYPNPATDVLTLKVEDLDYSTLTFFLYDMNGMLLESKDIAGNETSIAMSNLKPATYFLRVTDNNKDVKTFKIIKK